MNLFNFFKSSSPAHNEIAENGADKVLSSEKENPSVHKTYVNFPTSRKSALDVPLYAISSGRSERPKNGADAQPCLSDVYKNGTQAKRRQADVPLCGRSMVEMLGVLAIIGVLSVGAIAGYSKAMIKYRLNKSLEQTFYIIYLANEYKDEFKSSHASSIYYIQYFIKMNLIPGDMIKKNVLNYVYDKLGHEMGVAEIGNGQTRTFGISARNLNNRETEIFYCQSIINHAKEYENVTTLRIWSSKGANYYFHNTDNNKALQTATLNQIRNACAHVIEEGSLYMHINFK